MSTADDQAINEAIETARKESEKLLSVGQYQQALITALDAPASKDEKIKSQQALSVSTILNTIKDDSINPTINQLNDQQRLTCMKMVYRGMAAGAPNCAVLLKWHAALYDKDGVGSILRVIVDRNL